jgi:hypothetical protein
MIVKPIPSIEGAYANELGQVKMPECEAAMPHGGVRKYKTKWIYGTRTKASKSARHEYMGLLYRGRNYKIHRLVCEAFHGQQPTDKPVVIHLDEDATNNRPENLKWGTQKENLNAPGFIEYCKSRTGENNPAIKGRKKKVTT